MRAARVSWKGASHAAVLEGKSGYRLVPDSDLDPIAIIANEGWDALLARASIEAQEDELSLLAPIRRPGKILAVGLNYWDHALEQGLEPPKTPVLFAKMPSAVTDPGKSIPLHPVTSKLDYEAELAVVIGRRIKAIAKEEVPEAIAGYTIVNDVSARDLQHLDGQWVRAKSLDGYAPMGPVLVSPDEIDDPMALDIECYVNDELRQKSNTKNLIFDVFTLVAFCAEAITLEPGDVICTGTPGGVGTFMAPPTYLKSGDVVRIYVERIGDLVNPVGEG